MKYLLIIVALLLSGCSAAPWSCKAQAEPFLSEMRPLWDEWQDAVTLAGQTPRMALAGQIAVMQDIRRRAGAVQAPDCAKEIKTHYIASMDATLEGFLAFLGQKSDEAQRVAFDEATTEAGAAADAIRALK